jgi:hypothetical protein
MGRGRRPWFHYACGILASDFSLPPSVMFNEPVRENDGGRAYQAVEPAENARTRTHHVRDYIRAYYAHRLDPSVPVPENPTLYARRMRKLAQQAAVGGQQVVRSDPPGDKEPK